MRRDDLGLVEDIMREIRDVLEFIEGFDRDRFVNDRRTAKAVIYSIQIMGEAAGHLSSEFKKAHAQVPWDEVIGMRHKLVHGYWGVSYDLVWSAAREEVPILEAVLAPLLPGEAR